MSDFKALSLIGEKAIFFVSVLLLVCVVCIYVCNILFGVVVRSFLRIRTLYEAGS